ncbi:MAG: DUF1732 domain-containing protein, partial [Verrucomicrobia bacterium]|nr:DUF1732 domain-containing protein [Verrucomicrobiota bacterium]
EVLQQVRTKITDRITELVAQPDFDRLEQELVYLTQKMDVSEELDRLNTHITEVLRVLNEKDPVGRRLDFLMQELNREATTFVGDLMQMPPMVSAVKKDGVPLYKLARKGVEVERKERLVHIYHFRFTGYEEPIGMFGINCTKGTYVRSIAHDLGQRLGCGAHLKTLRRTESGKFKVSDAIPMEDALRLPLGELEKRVIPILQLAQSLAGSV